MSVAYDSYTITDLTDENIFIVYSAYPNGKNGSDNSFSTEPNKYIGIYKGTSSSAPVDASSYSWSQLIGDTGATGTGIASITEEHYLSTSKETQTGGSWEPTPPTWEYGKYIWTRSKIVYTNPSNTVYTTPICDSSWEAVNEIDITVTQLLRGTNNDNVLSDTGTWIAGTWKHTLTDVEFEEVAEIIKPIEVSDAPNPNITYGYAITGTAGSSVGIEQDGVPVVNGKTYTMSIYARGTGNLVFQYGKDPYVTKIFALDNVTDWQRYIYTFTIGESADNSTDGSTNISFIQNDSDGVLEICGAKLEMGNRATGWSQAPKDLDTEIYRVEMKADQANESISLKVWKNETYITGYDEEGNPISKDLEQLMSEIFLNDDGILSRVGHNEAAIGTAEDAPSESGSLFSRISELKQTANEFFICVRNDSEESSISITDKAISAIANSINMNGTQLLHGGAIISHTIKTDALSTDAIKSLNYSENDSGNVIAGSFLNLADGSFKSKYLFWNEEGAINAKSGVIGGCTIEDGKLTIPGGNIIETSITSDKLDIENIFSNKAIIDKIISNEIFSNAIATNGILSATSQKANETAKKLDELTSQFLDLKNNCSVSITEDIYQYHGNGAPTLDSYPSSEFFESQVCSESIYVLDDLLVSVNTYDDHLGDIYKDDNNDTYYQFRKSDDGTYGWFQMTQDEIFAISPGVAGILIDNDSVGIIASNLGYTGSLSIEKDVVSIAFDETTVFTAKADGIRASTIYCC